MNPLLRDELAELLRENAHKLIRKAPETAPEEPRSAPPRSFKLGRVAGFAMLACTVAMLWWTGLFELAPKQDIPAHLSTWLVQTTHDTFLAGTLFVAAGTAVLSFLSWICWRFWVP